VTPPRGSTRALLGALAISGLVAAPASAASIIGSTSSPTVNCGAGYTFVQDPSPPGVPYAAPSNGVITSWRFEATGGPPQIKFKAFRPTGGGHFKVLAESAATVPAASTSTTYPIRIPVRAGDVIGLSILTAGNCATLGGSQMFVAGDSAPGSDLPYEATPHTLEVAATVEPDADSDGYGDETQDQCPAQVGTAGACDLVAPVAKFTAGPSRTTRSKAKFTFVADDAGARYECRLTGRNVKKIQQKSWHPCSSPLKLKKLTLGTYKVWVRAIDAAGNVGKPVKTKLTVEKDD